MAILSGVFVPLYLTVAIGFLWANLVCSKLFNLAICLTVSNSLIKAAKTSLVAPKSSSRKSGKSSSLSSTTKKIKQILTKTLKH